MNLSSGLSLMLNGWRLTTAEILYRLPDHPSLLQSYVWQELDLTPEFPALRKFLDYWERHLEGKLHSVKICQAGLVAPSELRFAEQVGYLQ
jgi:uncharacterized protein Usg